MYSIYNRSTCMRKACTYKQAVTVILHFFILKFITLRNSTEKIGISLPYAKLIPILDKTQAILLNDFASNVTKIKKNKNFMLKYFHIFMF